MTNEEAINILKSKMDGSVDTSYEWAETVRLAIKALEQQEQKWKRLMMYLAELQLTYSPGWGANGCGDQKLYAFVTRLIEELEGWEEGDE